MHKAKYYACKYREMYMRMAEVCAKSSVAGRGGVGCVIMLPDLSLYHGWNGMPEGSDTEVCEVDNVTKPEVLHAEENAMRKADWHENSTMDSVAFVTLLPCEKCAKKLFDFGVRTVYYKDTYRCDKGLQLMIESEMEVIKL